MFAAQCLQLVGRKVHDDQRTPRGQQASAFAHRKFRFVQKVQHVVQCDNVRTTIRQAGSRQVLVQQPVMAQARLVQSRPRYAQHLATGVDPDSIYRLCRK